MPDETARGRARKPAFVRDLLIAGALFVCGAVIGMVYVSTWGQTALFYQNLFGPPAMFALGKGYVNPDLAKTPALKEFLYTSPYAAIKARTPPAIDRLNPADQPAHIDTKPVGAIQKREFYLLGTVALLWSVLGVAWSSLTPLFGALYGASAAASYGIFRLGMNRVFAAACAILFMTSPIHLEYLPWLRDYSKAPFILAAVFLTGLLARRSLKPRALALASAVCAAAIGIGIGFRIDVLICIPPFVAMLLFFLPRENRPRWRVRFAALAVFAATFIVSAWPILSVLGESGNKAHPALLGLMDPFSQRLGVGGVDYTLGHKYLDIESLALVNAYARHLDPQAPALMYETPAFERAADPYLRLIATTFPADLAIRAYAAVLRVLDELRAGPDHYLPSGVSNRAVVAAYKARLLVERYALGHTRYLALIALAALAMRNLRLAFAALGMTLYFAGYSAVQFGSRNVFHLEVIPLWITGLAACYAWTCARGAWRGGLIRKRIADLRANPGIMLRPVARLGLFTAISAALVFVPLYGLRAWQDARVLRLLQSYDNAARTPVAVKTTPLDNEKVLIQGTDDVGKDALPWPTTETRFASDFLMAEFANGPRAIPVRVAYTSDCFETDLTWDAVIHPQTSPDGITRLYFPVYYGSWTEYLPQWTCFRGVELQEVDQPAFRGLFRLESPDQFPIRLCASLTSDWQTRPRHERLTR